MLTMGWTGEAAAASLTMDQTSWRCPATLAAGLKGSARRGVADMALRGDGEEGEEMIGAMGATVAVMVVDLGMLWVRARLAIAARMAVGGGRWWAVVGLRAQGGPSSSRGRHSVGAEVQPMSHIACRSMSRPPKKTARRVHP